MDREGQIRPGDAPTEEALDSTAQLLERARAGDERAKLRMIERYLPALRRWARGRLPARARDLEETDDLVQATLLKALGQIEQFQPRHDGAFIAYLRKILDNQLRDRYRQARRRPRNELLNDQEQAHDASPLERAMTAELFQAYETGLERLPADRREAIVLRLELGFSYADIAKALGRPTANAARMLITRGLEQLVVSMEAK